MNANLARFNRDAAATKSREPKSPDSQRIDGLDWRAALARRNDRIIGDERNITLALRLAPELSGLVAFNEFALRTEFTRPPPWRSAATGEAWTDDDDTALQVWLQERDIDVRQRHVVADAVHLVSKDKVVHPPRAYLEALVWDGVGRLDCWLQKYLGSQGPLEYLRAVGARFLISAAARVMRPGSQVDHVLVLESKQGFGKSSASRILAVKPDRKSVV